MGDSSRMNETSKYKNEIDLRRSLVTSELEMVKVSVKKSP